MAFRKRRRSSIFGDDFFPSFGDDFFSDDFDDLFRSMFENIRELPSQKLKPGEPIVYGFSMKVGPDGRPQVEEFGNVQKGKVKDEREPLVDVINEEKTIRVIAELPGVDKSGIKIKARPQELDIHVSNPERRFAKTVRLPEPVVDASAKASYKNGILEVVLQKVCVVKQPAKGKAVKVD